ncbi:hypothetical protein GCM10010512_49820 [Streptomyces thermoviolaceus subsp. thermoviolaceus]|nr:hypothetical protein GCM10010499_24190 [Streptomyces thermoviolaceus subsp. apingens]GHB12456.1 hypothetical protein GCM10010512_49820 [Streptomyces thermoviolaceus subsp. thermoviolaceus]
MPHETYHVGTQQGLIGEQSVDVLHTDEIAGRYTTTGDMHPLSPDVGREFLFVTDTAAKCRRIDRQHSSGLTGFLVIVNRNQWLLPTAQCRGVDDSDPRRLSITGDHAATVPWPGNAHQTP